ncbi:MAG: hypothetical protein V4727_09810 [Verrucomicrobiota bacterium]
MKVKKVILLNLITLSICAFSIILYLWGQKEIAAAARAYATSNAKQISTALRDFKTAYGNYPDQTTAPLAAAKMEIQLDTHTKSSNARFRQLLQAYPTISEPIFFAKTSHTFKPDGAIEPGEAIKPGECGFAYIENVRTDDGIPRPIAIAPASLTNGKFEYDPFRGKAVVLWTDGSVSSLLIDRSTNHVMLDGKNLFDPMHPIWAGTEPRLLMPEGK